MVVVDAFNLNIIGIARLAIDLDGDGGLVVGFDADHGDALEVRAVRPARLDAVCLQLAGDVAGGQPQQHETRD